LTEISLFCYNCIEQKHTATVIDGFNNEKAIADRFASVFQDACVPNSLQRHGELETQFFTRHSQYVGDKFNDNIVTVELVGECIDKLKKGKAPGLDDLTAEHFICSSYLIGTLIVTV